MSTVRSIPVFQHTEMSVRLTASNYLPPRHSTSLHMAESSTSSTYGDCLWEQGRLWCLRGLTNERHYQAHRANQKPREFVQYKRGLARARSELPHSHELSVGPGQKRSKVWWEDSSLTEESEKSTECVAATVRNRESRFRNLELTNMSRRTL